MPSIKVREASYTDIDYNISLLARHDMEFGNRSAAELRHIWENNPSIKDCGKHWPIGWVLEKDKHVIVGFIGNIPLMYQLNERKRIATCMSLWVVDATYRKYSSALIFRYFRQETADMLVNPNTSSKVSCKFFTAFKAKEIFKGSYNKVFFWIINYRQFTACLLKRMRVPFGNFLVLPYRCCYLLSINTPKRTA